MLLIRGEGGALGPSGDGGVSVLRGGVSQLRSLLLGRCPLCYGALSVVMVDSGEEVAIETLWWIAVRRSL